MRRTSKNLQRGPAGFTLVELLVSVAVTVMVLAGISVTFTGVQRAYQIQGQVKSTIEGARAASTYFSRVVRLAGYGIDPNFAFDFDDTQIPSSDKDNYPDNPVTPTFVTDDLAFRYRDPAILKRGALDSSGTTLTLDGTLAFETTHPSGQGLLVSCKGARQWLAMESATAINPGTTSVGVVSMGAGGFPPIPSPTVPNCFTATGADAPYVMVIREERIRVMSLGGRPFLVAFHDLRNPVGNPNFDPIVADVETFQVAYLMNRPIPGGQYATTPAVDDGSGGPQNPNWILGDEGSLDPDHVIPTTAVAPTAPPSYSIGYDAPERYTRHPGNIRAVRLTVVTKSTRALAGRQEFGISPFRVENWTPASLAPDRFYRTSSSTTVRVPNMLSRSFFTPPVRENASDDTELNTWGG